MEATAAGGTSTHCGIPAMEIGSNLTCREEYWLENNSRRVNKDISFVLSVFELYD